MDFVEPYSCKVVNCSTVVNYRIKIWQEVLEEVVSSIDLWAVLDKMRV